MKNKLQKNKNIEDLEHLLKSPFVLPRDPKKCEKERKRQF